MWAIVVAVYVLAFPYHPGLHSPNELCRLMQARAIVEFGDLDLNWTMQAYGPVGDLAYYRGRYYPSKAPLLSFAAVPIYAVLRTLQGGTGGKVSELALVYFSRLFLTVLPTLLVLVWIRRFLAEFVSGVCAEAITLTYALGTLAFSYSLLFMSHQPSAVLLFASFYGVWRWSRGERSEKSLLISGALASATVLAEYTTVIGVFAVGLLIIMTLREKHRGVSASVRALALFTLGSVPLTLLLMWYHTHAFGGPLESGYRHLADAAYQPWHQGGFLGVGLPHARAFFFSFFSPLRGLFTLAPALFLALPGMWLLLRRSQTEHELRPLAWTTLAILAGYTYFTSSFSYESWGWTTGPRHLTSLIPFLLLPCALAAERARASWFAGACGVMFAASVLITSALTFVNYIPDDVSNALFALAIPLIRSGYLTPSILCAVGLTNPVAGVLLWLGIASVVAWLLWAFRPPASPGAWLVALGTAAVLFLFQVISFQDSAADRQALALLQRVWLTPPGRPLTILSPGADSPRGLVR